VLRGWRTKEGSWRGALRACLVAAKSGMEHLKSSGAICATLPTGSRLWLHSGCIRIPGFTAVPFEILESIQWCILLVNRDLGGFLLQ